MVDGSYDIQMRTMLGMKHGRLTISTDGEFVQGILEILGTQNMIATGTVSGSALRFLGDMKTALGSVSYEAQGEIEDNTLTILAQTAVGDFKITGTRI